MRQSELIIPSAPLLAEAEESDEFEAAVELRSVLVAAELHGQRLDRALSELLPEFSRSYLQQLIESGRVDVNALTVRKSSLRVKAADVVRIELRPTPQSQAFMPQTMDLQIAFEDPHILVINKPAGLVVHPAPGNWSGTLLNGLLAYDKSIALVPRAGIVHRLDKDTSGLMVVARSRPVMDQLVRAIAEREVSRLYLAVGQRSWQGLARQTVEAAIGRDPRNRLRMAAVDLDKQSGKSAKTDFAVLANSQAGCLVRCTLHTGRTHQIRVHMASLGHPLVSDAVYGGAVDPSISRQALHAARLSFLHPVTGQSMVFDASPPDDFVRLLRNWGLRYNPETWAQNP